MELIKMFKKLGKALDITSNSDDINNVIEDIANGLPLLVANKENITAFVSETNLAKTALASDGSVYTNENGDIYIL